MALCLHRVLKVTIVHLDEVSALCDVTQNGKFDFLRHIVLINL